MIDADNRGRSRILRPSRRDVLLAGLAAAMLPTMVRQARASTFDIGGAEVTVVSDGSLSLPLDFVLPDVPEAEIKGLFEANGIPFGPLTPDCNVTLLRSGDRLAVFDAGSGSNFMATAGRLPENLAAAGIDPAEVTDVIFTHAHPDHLWGVLDDFDEEVFSAATYRMAKAEWDYWRAPETLEAMPEERKTFVVGAQNRLEAIAERMELFAPGDEVFPSVEAFDTAGHTPGHVSFMIHGNGESVAIIGDAISHAVISFHQPSWHSGTDQDPAAGVATRLALLDRLASEKSRIVGFHLPHPGIGRVERAEGAYRFAAEA